MKKSVVALAVAAASGAVCAQSSVTLFGVVDASVSSYSVSSQTNVTYSPLNPFVPASYKYTPSQSQTVLGNGGNIGSRLGIRGTEDLGGGLAASFWLEAPLSNDDGNGVRPFSFNRRSTVSLSGGFGEIRLGRDYTPTFWSDSVYDPFSSAGVGLNIITSVGGFNRTPWAIPGDSINYARASNSVAYYLPSGLGGFYGQVMYAFHENVQTDAPVLGTGALTTPYTGIGSTRGAYWGGRFGYTKGPLDIALAYGESTLGNLAGTLANSAGVVSGASAFASAYDAKVKTWNLGGSYDFGVVKLVGEYSNKQTSFDQPSILTPALLTAGSSGNSTDKGWLLGALIPVGPAMIKLSYSTVKTSQPSTLGGFVPLGGLQVPYYVGVPDPQASKFAVGLEYNLSKRTVLYGTVARVTNKNGSAVTVYPTPPGSQSLTSITGTPNANSTGYDLGIRHTF